jgi:hypothetical protein
MCASDLQRSTHGVHVRCVAQARGDEQRRDPALMDRVDRAKAGGVLPACMSTTRSVLS